MILFFPCHGNVLSETKLYMSKHAFVLQLVLLYIIPFFFLSHPFSWLCLCECFFFFFFFLTGGREGGSCFLLMLASCIYNYAYFMFTWDRYCFEECLTPVEYDVSLTNIEGNQHTLQAAHSSGAVWESRWTSWAVRPDEPSGFRGRKELLNRASALVTTCP